MDQHSGHRRQLDRRAAATLLLAYRAAARAINAQLPQAVASRYGVARLYVNLPNALADTSNRLDAAVVANRANTCLWLGNWLMRASIC